MEIRFDGKRAMVTGAGKGIGRDIAKALHKCGADTVALSRTQADLDSLKEECPGIQIVTQDLSDWTRTRDTVSDLGNFDLLVNNAAVQRVGPFLEFGEKDIDFIFDTNFKGVFNVTQTVARGMVERGTGGAIVNISSLAATRGFDRHSLYCPSKAALNSLTQVLAIELGPKKIRVNSVLPTVVMTDMGRLGWSDPAKANPFIARTPTGRFAEVEDVTNAVLFLLSDKAAMINGTMLPVDGGYLAN
ncbi:hypothetical protein BaRGS_00007828 [Batillaria attramentaria]|uniref:Ketoreductase domain-containing protein n=1 Tax=Batillaria attramentaria TaxID=370345 RepID=A0ABD0LN98_9CAEN